MSINPAQAAKAYMTVGNRLTDKLASGSDAGGEAQSGGFGNVLKKVVEGASDTGRATEAKAADITSGRADIVDLVTAVAETEVALETMVTIRDRVISAYQEILNMPV